MFARKTDLTELKEQYELKKAEWDAKHSQCDEHRRKTDDHLLAIRVLLENFITQASPSIKFVDDRRTFANVFKDACVWIAGVAGGVYVVLKLLGVS